MNKLSPYEQLIADKIQQLPVPDMSHSIWSQVEQALDAGAGSDQGPSQKPGGNSYPGNAIYFYVAGCVIIGIIIAVLIGSKRSKKPARIQPPGIEQRSIPQQDSPAQLKETGNNNINVILPKLPVKTNDSAAIQLLPLVRTDMDSILNVPAVVRARDSATIFNKGLVLLPRPDSIISPPIVPLKKPRGVTNISDTDYKIKGYKDSTSND